MLGDAARSRVVIAGLYRPGEQISMPEALHPGRSCDQARSTAAQITEMVFPNFSGLDLHDWGPRTTAL